MPRRTAPSLPHRAEKSRFVGTLAFQDGYPSAPTVRRLYDELDFQRGCQVFLRNIMAASMYFFREGLRRDLGFKSPRDVAVFRCDASVLMLTPNSETVYATTFLDLQADGPTVIEVPPGVLGLLDDMWMRAVQDLGIAGPDQGKGGQYLIVPPGYQGGIPAGYFVARPRTYGLWFFLRGFLGKGGDVAPAFATLRQLRIYPLSRAGAPPPMNVVTPGRRTVDTIPPTDLRYFRHLAALVEEEPADAPGPENAAMLATIGIRKGVPFEPDRRMRAILEESARVGGFMAQALSEAPRTAGMQRTPKRRWLAEVPGYPTFLDGDRPLLDETVVMGWFATGTATAMGHPKPGTGSVYAWTYTDKAGQWLRGEKTYRVHLPAPIPCKDFWSVIVYDNWTRSMLANGQTFPSKSTYDDGLEKNADGSVDLYFGPRPPKNRGGNWIRTLRGQGWFVIFRLYGPLQAWFDGSWQPGDMERVRQETI